MKCFPIYQNGDHQWLIFGQDDARPHNIIDTNQAVIRAGGKALLCDPGGQEVFPPMMAALTEIMPMDDVQAIFLSHQDPDVASSLAVWRQVSPPDMKVYLSWMWEEFLRHYDTEATFETIPDAGMPLPLGNLTLRIIPAHYLHSPGNLNLYDPVAKILFTGDIGAAVIPGHQRPNGIFVTDFEIHTGYITAFHKRWMASRPARDAWVRMVRAMDIDMLVPQHGLVYRGEDVKRFIDWFSTVEIGGGLAAYPQGK